MSVAGSASLLLAWASAWRPREHGLWAWVGVPLAVAICLVPSWRTVVGAVTVLAGFGAANALGRVLRTRRGRPWSAVFTGACVAAAGATAMVSVGAHGALVVGALGVVGMGSLAVLLLSGGRPWRSMWLEGAGVATLTLVGGVVAVSGGGQLSLVAPAMATLVGWQLLGLWWVNRQLGLAVPGRSPWRFGWLLPVVGIGGAISVATVLGRPLFPLLLALYPLRAALHAPLKGTRDSKRIGLTELAWASGVGALISGVAVYGAGFV